MKKIRGIQAAMLAALICVAGGTQAQSYPDKSVRVIIGQPAGGAVDTVARLLAEQMTAKLGQSVVVENRPGASGMIAAQATARARPDGYTLGLLDAGALAVNPVLHKTISYDVSSDFTHLGLVAKIPLVLAAHPSLPVSSLEELTGYLKERPDELSYASSGVGGPLHLAMETYKQQAGVEVSHVPYQGGAPALTSVIGGHVPLLFIDTNLGAEHRESGNIKLFAVATKERNSRMPDVPTFDEAGIADFEFAPWVGLTGPAGMPAQVVETLTTTLAEIVAADDFRSKIDDVGLTATGSSSQEFADFAASELDAYTVLIKEGNISLNN